MLSIMYCVAMTEWRVYRKDSDLKLTLVYTGTLTECGAYLLGYTNVSL